MTEPKSLTLKSANVLDVESGSLVGARNIYIENGVIREISATDVTRGETEIDLNGLTLMPGLCDAHVHVTASTASFPQLQTWPQSYATARATRILHHMLMRGFTTVRDCGGADYGLALAVDEGTIPGPRILFCGNALSQTAGHSDMRSIHDNHDIDPYGPGLGCLVDGVSEMRKACRSELRKGAHFIKIMGSGGISSPTDHIQNTQFSMDELRAAVEEAEANRTYVAGHLYTAKSIVRALECGVTSIEHGNLADEATLQMIKDKDAFLVPTMSTHEAIAEEGIKVGFPPDLQKKVYEVVHAGYETHAKAHQMGLKMVYGTDLIGPMHVHQLLEFELRGKFQQPIDTIRSATTMAARLFRMEQELGQVREGFRADLLALEGNPLDDVSVLTNPDQHLKVIVKEGTVFKNGL
ncbi:MAG: amidohydrolase family protein [Pseudomonadota bacterium]